MYRKTKIHGSYGNKTPSPLLPVIPWQKIRIKTRGASRMSNLCELSQVRRKSRGFLQNAPEDFLCYGFRTGSHLETAACQFHAVVNLERIRNNKTKCFIHKIPSFSADRFLPLPISNRSTCVNKRSSYEYSAPRFCYISQQNIRQGGISHAHRLFNPRLRQMRHRQKSSEATAH